MEGQRREGQGRTYGNNRLVRNKRSGPGGSRPWKPQNGRGQAYPGAQELDPGRNQALNGERRPDESILQDVTSRLAQHSKIDATHIDVAVLDGKVTLSGKVNTCDESLFAERAIEAIPGVIRVHNQMEVREE